MKKLIALSFAAVAVGAIVWSSVAWASCPRGTSYQCQQGFNGKVICGCR